MQSIEAKRLLGQPSSSTQTTSATSGSAIEPNNDSETVLDILSPDGPTLVEYTAEFWPYQIPTPQERESILQRSITDMQKRLRSKVQCPSGQNRVWHEQVLRFMQRQLMESTIPSRPNQPGRTQLSMEIACFSRGSYGPPS